jgi:hypothetical protein
MSDFALAARNESFEEIISILRTQQGRKLDVVAPASQISITPDSSQLVVSGASMAMDADGVTPVDGLYDATEVFWDGISDKLTLPRAYLRRMLTERPDMLAMNVNGWLHGGVTQRFDDVPLDYPADPRNFLLRLFRGDDGGTGVARAMLSDTYKLTMDNLDVLMAALSGVKQAGVAIDITSCNLTERRLRVRVEAPEVRALAPVLLSQYRNPFADPSVKRAGGWSVDSARAAAQREGLARDIGSEPVVWSGFEITNSETGGGAYRLTPIIKVEICGNALVIEVDSLRQVHLGQRLDAGLFRVGEDTAAKELELIGLRARDAVSTWLDTEWLATTIARLEEKAGAPVKDPAAVVETVTKGLQFTKEEQAGVFDFFIRGGQISAGGVMQAVTAYAQTVEDPDRAYDVERAGVPALEAAFKLA